jgi:hypothetical protein
VNAETRLGQFAPDMAEPPNSRNAHIEVKHLRLRLFKELKMDITINEKSVRRMANRMRKALGNEVVTQSKAFEAVAQTLGFKNWDTLAAMLKKEVVPTFVFNEEIELFIDTFSCDEWCSAPSWSAVKVNQAFIDQILELKTLCVSRNMEHATRSVDVVEWDESEELNVCYDELYVDDHRWWFHASPKHSDYAVESRAIYIDDFLETLLTKKNVRGFEWRNGVLFYDPSEDVSGLLETLVHYERLDESFLPDEN